MISAAEGVVLEREFWTTWPSQEALSRSYRRSTHRWMSLVMRLLILAALFGGTFAQGGFATRHPVAVIASGLLAAGSVVVLVRCTLLNRVAYSVAILLLLLGGAFAARSVQLDFAATVLWCGSAVIGMQRLPLGVAVPLNGIALGAYAAFGTRDGGWATLLATLGLGLVGYVLRLDAESRGSMQRLLRQERAARVAEAETAALRERGRIAREIHDVLAHSLSAQLVHLEAARLLIERGGERDDVLERVVAARRMARQGLAETRQALSALRGEMTSAEEFLRELVESEGAGLQVEGDQRHLPAEAGQAVRRVAQEAMTNVRKHARGAKVAVRLQYHTKEVELEVRDFGGRPVDNSGSEPVDNELGVSGSGYGLLGMRERAELLGGTLEAGPVEEGFVVRLRVPA
nr:histidine kinase [Streptantibioticus silvisoli]